MARKALLIALALTLALAGAAHAQKSADKKPASLSSAPSAAAAGHATVTNFGQRWTAMTDKERDMFIEGMTTAIRLVCTNAVLGQETKPVDMQAANKSFMECFAGVFPYKPGDIKSAMTSLYQDKNNNIVPYDIMYGMALLKVKGDPYEDNLARLRQDLAKRK